VLTPFWARADATAEQLYQQGRDAARGKNWALACARFLVSQEREPAPGTLLNLADCEEHLGRLLDALGHFETAARTFKPGDERVLYARQRALAVAGRAPKLTIRLDPGAVPDTAVELDGVAGPAPSDKPILVDPGEHVIVVRAPRRAPVRSTIRMAEGEARELVLSPGGAVATEPGPVASARAVEPGASPAPHVATVSDPAPLEPLRPAGYASLAVGALGLGIGTLGGLLTLSAKGAADDACTQSGCTEAGLNAESRGKTWSTISTVGFVVGGLGLATGALLLWLAPSRRAPAIVARPAQGGGEARFVASF
jgi:hypothetical protein